jgi:autotransporter translocation and assembly factor TamB
MKPTLKPVLRIVAALLAVVFMMVCGMLFWLQSRPGRQWVQARINTAIPGKITIETYRLSLLKPGLDLYGVVLHDPRGHALAGFDRLSVVLDGLALWDREIRLKTVWLGSPWVELASHESNGLNLMAALAPPARKKEPQAPTPERAGLPVNIVFESIQLVDGRFGFRTSDDTTRVEATGITLRADGDLMDRSGNLALTIAEVRFNGAGIHPQPARIGLKARLDGDKLSVPALDVTSGQTTLRLSGSADSLTTTPMLNSVLSVDSQLAELKTIFNLAGDYRGPVNARFTLKGDVANPDAGLVLTVDGGRIAGQPLDHGALSINLHDRLATIHTAAWRLADGSLKLNGKVDLRETFPTGFLEPPADADTIAYTLTLDPDIPDLNPWLHPFIDIHGRMTGRVSLTGKGVIPTDASARLTLKGSGQDLLAPGMDRPVAADVNLSAQLDRGRVTLSDLNVAAEGLALSGEGRFQIDNRALAGKLALTADDLSRALAVVGMPSVRGAGQADLMVDGSLNRPQFSLFAVSKNLQVDTYTLGDLTVDAAMDHDGRLNLKSLNLHNRNSRIRGSGRLRLLADGGGIDPVFVNVLDLTLEKLSADDFMQSPPLTGSFDGRLQVKGPLGSLMGELSLNGTALRADAATIGDVDARIRLDAGTVFLDRLHLRNKDSRLTVAGSIRLLAANTLRLLENPLFDFSAESDRIDPGDFFDAAHGDFTITGKLTGSIENPVGRFTLTGRQANLAGQPMETIAIDGRFEERRLWLDRFLAALAPGEQIEGGGWVGLDQTMDLRVKSDGISATRIQRLHEFFPGEGILRFDVTGQGSLHNPDIEGNLTVSGLIVNDGPIEDVNLKFSLHDMLARATGRLNFGMDATCDLKKGDFEARLTFDRTETAAYFKIAGQPDFHGTLTGRVQAAGNIRDLANASAQLDLKAVHLLFKDITLIDSGRMALKLADQDLSIAEFELGVLSSGSLRLTGGARLGDRLDLDVHGRIPLAAAGVFSEALSGSSGMLALAGRVSGDIAAPQIDARIDLEKIGMAVPGLAQKLHDLNGRIHLTADRIRIEALNGFLDTGSFRIDGSVEHENFKPRGMALDIVAQSLPLEVPDTLTVLLNGDLKIRGNDRTADARGAIVLLEGVYYKDIKINLLQMATRHQRAVVPMAKPLSIPYFETVNLDIAVGHRQPFMVQNNLAQLEISPDLKIGGNLGHPIVSGRTRVKTGTVTFQKKTFDVKKGVIDFVNPYKTEAEIDIESETTIRNWTIKLAIKGTLDNLALHLSSVPAENESDILSLILFGRTARELTTGEGGTQRSTGQIMAEMIAETFGEDIKRTTGVDILQMEASGSSDGRDDAGVKVTVGKHLSDRMTVKYAVGSKDGAVVQRAIAEYKLLENILVSGFQDSRGVYGSELVFRVEFR